MCVCVCVCLFVCVRFRFVFNVMLYFVRTNYVYIKHTLYVDD